MTGRVETRVVRIGLLGDGQQGVLAHSRVLGLVEGEDVDVVVGCEMAKWVSLSASVCGSMKKGVGEALTVFLDDAVGIGGSVETRHQDEGDVAEANKRMESSPISTCEPLVQATLPDVHVVGLVEVLSSAKQETISVHGPIPTKTSPASLITHLDLPNTQVQEGQSIPDLDYRLGSLTTLQERTPERTQPSSDELKLCGRKAYSPW